MRDLFRPFPRSFPLTSFLLFHFPPLSPRLSPLFFFRLFALAERGRGSGRTGESRLPSTTAAHGRVPYAGGIDGIKARRANRYDSRDKKVSFGGDLTRRGQTRAGVSREMRVAAARESGGNPAGIAVFSRVESRSRITATKVMKIIKYRAISTSS